MVVLAQSICVPSSHPTHPPVSPTEVLNEIFMSEKKSATHVFSLRSARSGAATLLAASLLAACGGGGGDTNPQPDPLPIVTLDAAQGIWQSAPSAATRASAIVLPDGALWAVLSEGEGSSATTRLIKAKLSVQDNKYTADAKSHVLGGALSAPASFSLAATVKEKLSLVVQLNPAAGTDPAAAAQTLSLSWQTRYDTPTALADLAGRWRAPLGAGTVSWDIDALGKISGTRTTGCTYTGQFSLRPERKAVVDVAVNEDCAGAKVQLRGIATPQANGLLNLAMTTEDETQAVLIGLAK